MRKRSRVLGVLLATAMAAASLAGCGGSTGTTEAAKDTTAETTAAGTEAAETAATDKAADKAAAETEAADSEKATTAASADATELEMWTFVELHGNHFQDMAEKWNEANPDRQVSLNVNVLPYEDMHNKLQIALQSGEGAPDIVDIELGKFANFLKGEPQLEALNDAIDPYREDIVASRIELYSKDGKNYGIPSHVGATVAFYNTEMLEAADIDYTTIKTYADLKEAGLKLKEATGKYIISADTSALWQLNDLIAQQKKDWVDDAGNVNVNIPEAQKGLETLKDLQTAGVATTIPGGNPDTEEAYAYYNAGEVACAIMPMWQMSRYTSYMTDLKGKIAIAPAPVLEEGMPSSVGGGGTGTCVTNQCSDVQLAKDFLAYAKLSVDGNIGLWNNLGFDPCNMDVWSMEEVTHNPDNEFVQYFKNNPFEVLNEIKDQIGLIKSTEAYPAINSTFSATTLNAIFDSDQDIAAALEEAQSQIENELQ
ncbi:ABC transporter substrate-binding protein [Robinsoniella peoriensis]|uniref:ABC transporter substrate-binding protein n=1 Tax=Robinsoniella peoriensis TaxID=180332 RepID=UPI00085C35CE|nr:extracellular solute-binding protein [Robinsoniella peoriensis]